MPLPPTPTDADEGVRALAIEVSNVVRNRNTSVRGRTDALLGLVATRATARFMGYRRFRRLLPLVARRPSLVARPTVDRQALTEMPSCRTADGDRRSLLGVSKSR
mgnify:CR=1 FL=1